MTHSPAVELRSISKRFGSVTANSEVSLSIAPGTIHGLVGENGAGKSTCVKMLYGLYAPDSGEILVGGKRQSFRSPTDAIQAGIGMVHQHFMLAPNYSVLDNIILGAEPLSSHTRFLPAPFRFVDRSAARTKIAESGEKYGLAMPTDVLSGSLTVGMQQRVEILKLLYRNARILILDEPTAVLTPQEVQELFANLRRLRDEGHSIIIITHKLEEVMAITSAVTVLRGGRVVGQVATATTSIQELATLMVGRDVNLRLEVAPGKVNGPVVLTVKDLHLRRSERKKKHALTGSKNLLERIDFEVRSGEIVGVAGVAGNGQRELFDTLLRLNSAKVKQAGMIRMFDKDVTNATTQEVRAQRVGVIPFDRHKEGLLLDSTALENSILGHETRPVTQRGGILSFKRITALAQKIFADFDVRPPDLQAKAAAFSGGNQQKMIVGRELTRDPLLIIAANPIRGVDVGAIEFIHRKLIEARDRGAGVLLFSSDLDEVLTLSDRILVMYEGRITGTFVRGRASVAKIGLLMGGAKASLAPEGSL